MANRFESLHKLHVKDAEGCIIQEVAHQDTTRLTSQEVEFWCATHTGMTIKVEPGLVVPDLRHEDAAAERALASARLAQENQSRLIKVPNLLQGGEDGTVIEQGWQGNWPMWFLLCQGAIRGQVPESLADQGTWPAEDWRGLVSQFLGLPPQLLHFARRSWSSAQNVVEPFIDFGVLLVFERHARFRLAPTGSLWGEIKAPEGMASQIFKAVLQDLPSNLGVALHEQGPVGRSEADLLDKGHFHLVREGRMLQDSLLSIRLLQDGYLDGCLLWARSLETKGCRKKCKIFLLTRQFVGRGEAKEVDVICMVDNQIKVVDAGVLCAFHLSHGEGHESEGSKRHFWKNQGWDGSAWKGVHKSFNLS